MIANGANLSDVLNELCAAIDTHSSSVVDVRASVMTKPADWLTQSYSLCLAFSNAFGVLRLPFMGKFIQLIQSAADFLHAFGQTISHGRRDRRLVMAEEKTLLFQVS